MQKSFSKIMANIITVVMTNKKLNAYNLSQKERFDVICDYVVSPGDMIKSPDYDMLLEVYLIKGEYHYEDNLWDSYPTLVVETINGKKPTAKCSNSGFFNEHYKNPKKSSNAMSTNSNSMLSGIIDKYKSQFYPEKEVDIRMSLNGLLCVPVDGEYIGIDSSNELVSFPMEMTIELPIYSVMKMNNTIQIGDIIKKGRTYAKVIKKNADGSLKCLTYSGGIRNQKEIKDFMLGSATTRVLINMFNFSTGENDFNPIMFMAMSGESFDVNSLLMLSMTPQGKNLFSNAGGGFNPMMLMMLDSNRRGGMGSNFMEMMMMANMMGGMNNNQFVNPLANMFNFNNNQPAMKPLNETTTVVASEDEDESDELSDMIKKIMNNPDALNKIKSLLGDEKNSK